MSIKYKYFLFLWPGNKNIVKNVSVGKVPAIANRGIKASARYVWRSFPDRSETLLVIMDRRKNVASIFYKFLAYLNLINRVGKTAQASYKP